MTETGAAAGTLGGRIRQARAAKGLAQADLAHAAGVRTPTLWRYEAGERMPRADVLGRLAEALGTTVQWLLYGDAPPSPADDSEHVYPAWEQFLQMPEAQSAPPEVIERLRGARWLRATPTVSTYLHLLAAELSVKPSKPGEDTRTEEDKRVDAEIDRLGMKRVDG